jgi:hypothetical protein
MSLCPACGVSDLPTHIDADPDPTLHFDAVAYQDQDPDPAHQSDANLRPLFYRQILHGSFMNLHVSIASNQGSPWLLSEPPKMKNP